MTGEAWSLHRPHTAGYGQNWRKISGDSTRISRECNPFSQSGAAASESSSACGVERDTSPNSLDPLCMCRSTVSELAEAGRDYNLLVRRLYGTRQRRRTAQQPLNDDRHAGVIEDDCSYTGTQGRWILIPQTRSHSLPSFVINSIITHCPCYAATRRASELQIPRQCNHRQRVLF